ncbi:MAG: glycine cleavage system protein GcvH [Sporolactobacillus sp.]
MTIPNDLFYSKDHEWVKKTNDSKVKIGITEYAQQELGDVVFVELPEAGRTIAVGQAFGSVESVKTVSELYAPVAGTVVAVNAALEDAPELVNQSPYDGAWMIELEADAFDFSGLLSAAAYQQLTAEEE